MYKQNHSSFRLIPVVFLVLLVIAIATPRADAALPGTWTPADVGLPAIRGSAQETTCTISTGCPVFTISGAGQGIGGTSDQFMFVYQKLTGDGIVKLRLLSLAGTTTMEAGLMVRDSLSAGARYAAILGSGSRFAFRSRASVGANTESLDVARGGWLRLERVGPTITASISSDGTQWTVVATQSLKLKSTAYFGIAVSSRADAMQATATVSNMSVTATTPTMPPGWASVDVGLAPSPGTASYSGGSFIGASSAAGLSATADAFRFVYARVRGDAKLTTRVAASQGRAGRQAGIVLRTTLDAGAVEAALLADDLGVVLLRRTGTGQAVATTRVVSSVAPVHLRLDRASSMVSVAYSTDGATWKTAAGIAVPFTAELYAGLAVAAGPNGGQSAAAFDALSLISVAANAPPVVSLSAPLTGQTFTEGAPVAISATASDPDDLVARVDFSVNGVKIATDSAAPYSTSWIAGAPGAYSIVATAADFDGAVTSSLPAAITVVPKVVDPGPGGGGPWRLLFDASMDHVKLKHYILEIYNNSTNVLVASLNIGKPTPAADGGCNVDINGFVSGLPSGRYDGLVRAVDNSGTAASIPYTFSK